MVNIKLTVKRKIQNTSDLLDSPFDEMFNKECMPVENSLMNIFKYQEYLQEHVLEYIDYAGYTKYIFTEDLYLCKSKTYCLNYSLNSNRFGADKHYYTEFPPKNHEIYM